MWAKKKQIGLGKPRSVFFVKSKTTASKTAFYFALSAWFLVGQ
jgi:hypothetical protein